MAEHRLQRACPPAAFAVRAALVGAAVCLTFAGAGCGALDGPGAAGGTDAGTTAGPPYEEPAAVPTATFSEADAVQFANAAIDVSTASQGYVGVSAQADSRLKFQAVTDEATYSYDLAGDGTPLIVPLNMGSATYTFRVMQNTSGSNYVEVAQTTADVELESSLAPFLHPDVYCSFTPDSSCVAKARELVADAQNEGDAVRSIYEWLVANIAYDDAKAAQLADVTGYIPEPDETLATQSGICFDYASLAAAMFRSSGIPCQVVTGYVSPGDLYHAWNMVYIDGQWVSAQISIEPDQWCRVDVTFAATGSGKNTGDGESYTVRYIY